MDDRLKIVSSIVEEAIHYIYLHPVRLELIKKEKEKIPVHDNHLIEKPEDFDIDKKYLDSILEEKGIEKKGIERKDEKIFVSWSWVAFPGKKLTVFSKTNGNKDERGGGCGNLEIPVSEFTWTVDTPDGITLEDLAMAVYRLKGSKYDYCYEMFCNLKFVSNSQNHLLLEADFDHGS